MLLIGMYDSPFVRRVAIALTLYDIPYDHRPWSVFRDADKIAPYNPVIRVPTLVLDHGETLIDSASIIDALDDIVGSKRALMPADGLERRKHLFVCSLASHLCDKVVSLIYESAVHGRVTPDWVTRCTRQIEGALDALEASRANNSGEYWFGSSISHADIITACVLTLAVEALSFDLNENRWPQLAAHRGRCEARPEFRAINQPFFAPPPKE